jgi:hypothetical protein
VAGDSDWSSVSLLLHGNGSNNGTTFTDSGPTGHTITRNSNAVTSTAQVKYGSAALSFPQSGTNDYLITPTSADFNFGTGNFTIEWWQYSGTQAGSNNACIGMASLPTNGGWKVLHRASSVDRFRFTYRDSGGSYVDITNNSTINNSTWHHMAVVRNGSTITLYLDGSSVASGTYAGIIGSSSVALNIGGMSGDGQYLTGYIDDVRITKGVARYTANFTPATAEFPDGPPSDLYGLGGSALGTGKAFAVNHVILGLGGSALGAGKALVTQANLYGLGASALGSGAARSWSQFANAQGGSALGSGRAALVNHWLQGLGSSALGAGKALANVPTVFRGLGGSALGSGRAVVFSDFTGSIDETADLRYVMELITPGGAVRVPISSWQATLQTGAACYVQCVVPAVADWVEDIIAATEFIVYRRATLTDGSVIDYEMARSPLEVRSYSQGPRNYTATISGYPDALTADDDPPTALDRTLTGVRSVSTDNGGIRVRADIDWLLRPGMRGYYGATPILVDFVNYYVPGNDQYMDVGERA